MKVAVIVIAWGFLYIEEAIQETKTLIPNLCILYRTLIKGSVKHKLWNYDPTTMFEDK